MQSHIRYGKDQVVPTENHASDSGGSNTGNEINKTTIVISLERNLGENNDTPLLLVSIFGKSVTYSDERVIVFDIFDELHEKSAYVPLVADVRVVAGHRLCKHIGPIYQSKQ